MAESKIVRKGGGGLAINGVEASFIVETGEAVTKGSYVEYTDELQKRVKDSIKNQKRDIYDAVELVSNTVSYIAIVPIGTTQVLVTYKDIDGYGKAAIIDVSTDTATINTVYTFYNTGTDINLTEIAKLTDTKVIIAYTRTAETNDLRGVVCDISGTTLSFGAEYVLDTGTSDITYSADKFVGVNSTTALILYAYYGTSYAKAMSVSGTVITLGSSIVPNTRDYRDGSLRKVDTDKAILCCRDYTSPYYVTAQILEVSGLVVTAGSAYTISTTSNDRAGVGVLDTSKAVFSANDTTSGNWISYVVGTISGTVITLGSKYNSTIEGDLNNPPMVPVTASKIIMISRNSSRNCNELLDISGTVVTTENLRDQMNVYSGEVRATLVGTNKVFVILSDTLTSTFVGKILDLDSTKVHAKIDGIAKTSGSATEAVTVYVPSL